MCFFFFFHESDLTLPVVCAGTVPAVLQHCSVAASRKAVVPPLWVRWTLIAKFYSQAHINRSYFCEHRANLYRRCEVLLHPWLPPDVVVLSLSGKFAAVLIHRGAACRRQFGCWEKCALAIKKKCGLFKIVVDSLLKSALFDYWQSALLKSGYTLRRNATALKLWPLKAIYWSALPFFRILSKDIIQVCHSVVRSATHISSECFSLLHSRTPLIWRTMFSLSL